MHASNPTLNMIAPPVSSALGAPAPQVVKAAQDAASKPHGLINLIRLVKSLEAASSDFGWEVEVDAWELSQVKKDAQVSFRLNAGTYKADWQIECPLRESLAPGFTVQQRRVSQGVCRMS
jgi:hypothetical protein